MLNIPSIAQTAGFSGVIVGIWNPADDLELTNAEVVEDNPIVMGYSIGNEGLYERYTLDILTAAMQRVRKKTGKPVSTTEQINDYYENSPLWQISDWIFPNAHPYFARIRDPKEAAQWTELVYHNLEHVSKKPIIFKEIGLPTAGDAGLDEINQAEYYRLMLASPVKFVVFEAFDAPWKHLNPPDVNGNYPLPDPEPHWGIFTSNRTPKLAVKGICDK